MVCGSAISRYAWDGHSTENMMAQFINPNEPRQPVGGVYEWFFERDRKRISLYIGQAGLPASHTERSTLFRGISQLARKTFTSDGKGQKLDTDFVVGSAIRFVERSFKTECVWEHISDDPNDERRLCQQRKPLIQNADTCTIYTEPKCAQGIANGLS